MRESLLVKDVSVPGFGEAIPAAEASRIEAQLKAWDATNFAGYRRLITEGSDCFPNLAEVRRLAAAHAKGASGKPITDFVLLGTGGSSLGGEALLHALHPRGNSPHFHFMDNNDPEWFHRTLASLQPETTLFYVVSKSGKTPETISQFLHSMEWIKAELGSSGENWKKHFVLCTDPTSGDFRSLAKRWNLPCLEVPTPVGGRFSVFTPVGLFPAAFAGLKIEDFLAGAQSVAAAGGAVGGTSLAANTCAQLARALALGQKERPITVLMPYSTQLGAASRWFCQLWAESLGKGGQGLTPYPAIGTTDQHSQMQLYMEGPRDKVIVLVHVREMARKLPLTLPAGVEDLPAFQELKDLSMFDLFDAEFRATRDALKKAGVPVAVIELDRLDEYSVGALLYFWEFATAVAGAVIGVNPFDQPGVEAAKILTKGYLKDPRS